MKKWYDTWFDTPYYHILYKDRNEQEAKYFISNLLHFLKPDKNDTFLDLACGKGRHSLMINSHGYKVEGIDISRNSITIANKLSNKHLAFNVHDIRTIYKPNSFNYALNLFTSFGYFENDIEHQNTIDSISHNLIENGKLIIDFLNVKKTLLNLTEYEEKIVDNITFKIRRSLKNNYLIKDIRFEDQGKSYHFTEKVKAYTLNDFINLFENAQMKIINLWGDYELNDFNAEDSPRLIITAQKCIH
ncbi:MAG: methyltransferase domain-containing protein [Flavobacteriales bacterium]